METIILHKRCKICQKDKPLADFYLLPTGHLGVTAKCKPCINAYNVKRRKEYVQKYGRKPLSERDKEVKRKSGRKYCRKIILQQYKLTVQQYEKMLISQNGVCAICQQPPKSNRQLAVDHDHKTGQVRGLLCTNCNLFLGQVHDDPILLKSAIKYLQKD